MSRCLHRWIGDSTTRVCLDCKITLSEWIKERNKDVPKSKGISIIDGRLIFEDGEVVVLKKDNWPKVGEDLEKWRKKDEDK